MADEPSAPSSFRIPSWLPLLGLAGTMIGLAWWSWRKWVDVFFDFGMELYLPWQLSQGKALYVDIAWKHGPFSQYFNTLLFKLFGVSLTTLIVANLLILAVLTWLIYQSFTKMCDRLTAFLVSVAFLCLFGFSQYTLMGNYNYICPYLHEQTHGFVFSVAMMYCLGRTVRSSHRMWSLFAGICLGVVALTKIELTVAAAVTAVFGLGMWCLATSHTRRKQLQILTSFIGGMLLVLLAGLLFLWSQMPLREAIKGLCGNWLYVGGSTVVRDGYYLYASGFDHPVQNVIRMVWLLIAFGLLLGLFIGANAASLRFPQYRLWMAGGAGLVVWLLALAPGTVSWEDAPRILPLTTLILWAGLTWHGWRQRQNLETFVRWLLPGMWALLGLVLLSKIILFGRLSHYGFVLAVPATLLLLACGLYWIPNWLTERTGSGAVFRAAFGGLLVAGCTFYLSLANDVYRHKTQPFGQGSDLVYTFPAQYDPMGDLLTLAIRDLETRLPAQATLLVLPHGVSLNYLLRHPNPTPYISYQYFDLKTYGGESVALNQIKVHPPDFIVLVHNGLGDFMTETEASYFGQSPDFGQLTMTWMRQNYVEVRRFGAEPFTSDQVGLSVYQRIPSTSTRQ